jgi:hypothetical protein
MTYIPKHLRPWKRPDSYMGAEWPDYFVTPFGVHRDSDALSESNNAVAVAKLRKACEAAGVDPDAPLPGTPAAKPDSLWGWADHSAILEPEASHWAIGWVRGLYVHKNAPEAVLRLADDLCERAESYPVLDEDDFSNREYESAASAWENYSVRDRVDIIKQSGSTASIFAARRAELPEDDNGALMEWLR